MIRNAVPALTANWSSLQTRSGELCEDRGACGRARKASYEDFERREKLLALARSPHVGREAVHEENYTDLKPTRTEVYFVVGDRIERMKSNRGLESAGGERHRSLLMTDPSRSVLRPRARPIRGQAAEVAQPGRREL